MDLHARGCVHGRLCPQSVILSGDQICLMDPQRVHSGSPSPYSSPEVVRGQTADSRSDIFSFGAILSQMLGRIPHAGAKPKGLEAVIDGCLEKDPARRRQRIGNVVAELKLCRCVERSSAAPSRHRKAAGVVRVAETGSRSRWVLIALIAIAFVALPAAVILSQRRPADPVLRFSIAAPENTTYPGTPAISPDGLTLAFSATAPDGHRTIWLRALDDTRARAIPGTEEGVAPFWSPDSRYLAFFANGSLLKVRVDTEAKPEIVAATEAHPGGGTWNRQGVILYSPGMSTGIYRVSSTGGKPEVMLKPDSGVGEEADLWPEFLPDERHFIYFSHSARGETATGIYLASLDPAEKPRMLFNSATNAVYSKEHLLYIKDGDLMERAFDASKLSLTGDAAPLLPGVGAVETLSLAPVSASANAVLVYQKIGKPFRQLVWMDRSGRTLASLGEAGNWGPPRISPDGKQVACGKLGQDGITGEIKIFSSDGRETLFDTAGISAGSPVWSPDGTRLAFWEAGSTRNYDLYVKPVTGGLAEQFHKSLYKKYPTDWSRDSQWVLFGEYTEDSQADVWVFQVAEGRAVTVLNTIHSEGYATLSPDGYWLAYQSDASGRNEVYVQAWEGGTGGTKRTWQVSQMGGGIPKWRADGRELFYMTADGAVMSAQVHPSAGEFRFASPQQLFRTLPFRESWNLYDVAADGQRFLLNVPTEWTNASPIIVTTNWTRKLPSNQR